MLNSKKSDEQLILSLSQGSNSAFESLYRRYERKLMGYLVFKLKNEDFAQEVFQETWMKVIDNAHRFKKGKDFAPWLIAIASNLVKDWFKKTDNYKRLLESFGYSTLNESSKIEQKLDLNFLSDQHKKIINYKYHEGLKSSVISEKLNLTEANVRKVSSRAIKAIKDHVQNGGEL